MRKSSFILMISVLLIAFGTASAFAAINTTLNAPDSVAIAATVDLTVDLSGTDNIGAITLNINFNNAAIEIVSITANQDGLVVPSADKLATVNTDGKFSLAYASTTGFAPGTSKTIATVGCKGKAEGSGTFTIDTATSNIKGSVFPPATITGTFTNDAINVTTAVVTTTTTTVSTTTTTAAATTTTTAAATTTTTAAATTTTTAPATTTTTGATTTTTTLACSVAGDVNGDGKKDIYDALAIAQFDVGALTSLACPTQADVDGDTKTTIYDALAIAASLTT